MFSSAIIVFREVFEIVLIVGIVLAATQDMPHRGKAVGFGIGLGLLGAALVGLFTDKIAALAEGAGQEIFNATILFTAAGFIGWTALWMKRHGHTMKAKIGDLRNAVEEGTVSYISLAIVIALAILREGAEIVLFSYGTLAAGQSWALFFGGATIGLIGGGAVGFLVYKGLLRLSMKHFFGFTSALLVILVAGMAASGTGFLIAAGYFSDFSQTLWDSSKFLDDGSVIGQFASALTGYTARPALAQVIVYVLTLGGLLMLMRLIDKPFPLKTATAALLLCGAATLGFASDANATKRVYAPYVEKGEVEVEWLGGYEHDEDDDVDGAWKQKMAIGYGVTDYWFTELYGEVEKEGEDDSDAEFTAVEWENRFQLTQAGEYWIDTGLYAAYELNTLGGADKVEAKLLMAKDTGNFSHRANVILEREVGEESSDETEWGLAWNTHYRYSEAAEPGFEIYSEFGEVGHEGTFDDQDHRIGPAIQGALGHGFKYDVGYLFGVSDGAPDGTVKTILEYEFRF
jgi:high-affinity iron transporter